jgi:hypothetical protein
MTTQTDIKVGDLVHVSGYISADGNVESKLGIVVKIKKLLKLYDVLLQVDKTYLKDVNIMFIDKI